MIEHVKLKSDRNAQLCLKCHSVGVALLARETCGVNRRGFRLLHLHLAEKPALHAQSEEAVLHPAAVLLNDLVRARGPRR